MFFYNESQIQSLSIKKKKKDIDQNKWGVYVRYVQRLSSVSSAAEASSYIRFAYTLVRSMTNTEQHKTDILVLVFASGGQNEKRVASLERQMVSDG